MFLGFVLVLVYCQHDKNVWMCKILNVLDLTHFERFHRLIWVHELNFHLVCFQHDQRISKCRYHDIHIVFTDFFFCEHYTKFLAKVIHNCILEHLLKLVLILIFEFVKFHLLLKLLRVNLLDYTIVLFEVNVELCRCWSLTVQRGDFCVCEVVVFL